MAEDTDIETPQTDAPPAPPPPAGGGDGDLQRLYNGLHEEGTYTKSYDEFKQKYSTPDAIDKLYNGLHDDGSYTKSKDDFYAKYFPTAKPSAIPKLSITDYLKPQGPAPSETTTDPTTAIKHRAGLDLSNDPLSVARRNQYTNLHTQMLADVESPEWKNKIFTGKVPALTDDPGMPVEAFQKVDTKGMESYLDSKNLSSDDRYWLRNQIINYGHQRLANYYINQRTLKNVSAIPAVKEAQDDANQQMVDGKITPEQYDQTWKAAVAKKPELVSDISVAYKQAAKQYEANQTAAIANKLNNVGLNDKPIDQNAPFHDEITGANKALMGALTFSGDTESQLSSLLSLTGIDRYGVLGYKMKTEADDSNAKNVVPQTGEAGNYLAGKILPMYLNMETFRRLAAGAGKPLYQGLANARASGMMGKFAEGALGGLAVSPVNSYLISTQYYDNLVKQGMDPGDASARAHQLLTKNMATDMLMTPLQMGLLKLPTAGIAMKALTMGAEGIVGGVHFGLQDFNQQSIDNPAMSIIDYASSGEGQKTMIEGAVLGMVQKAAVDKMHEWDTKSATKDMFQFNRKYGADLQPDLPSNQTIGNNVLAAIEMRDTPTRVQELKDLTGSMQDAGVYTPAETDRINKIIDDVDAVRKAVPKYGTPHQKMAVMNELLNQRTLDEFIAEAGNEAAAKPIQQLKKDSDTRIGDIMSGKEPLYFVNGNETTKDQLLEVLEKNPELLSMKGFKMNVINDEETQEKIANIKTDYDAIPKQGAATNDVRTTSSDRSTVGQGDESKRPVDQNAAGKEGGNEDQNFVKRFISKVKQFLEARHGDTDSDEAKKVSGQDMDPLSAKGRVDAARLAEQVNNDHNISKIISSDLKRAIETAQIVAGKTGATHEIRPELASWDLGDLQGMDDADFKKAQEYLVANPDTHEYEGKELGESFNEYKDRVIEAQKALLKEGPDTMVINHSNNMAVWDAWEKNGAGAWTDQMSKDYLNAEMAEPATLRERAADDIAPDIKSGDITEAQVHDAFKTAVDNIIPSGDHGIAEDIESGEVSPEELKTTFKQAIDDAEHTVQPLHQSGGDEAGSSEPHEASGREPAAGGDEKGVPQPGKNKGTEANPKDTGAKPVSSDTGATDKSRPVAKEDKPDYSMAPGFTLVTPGSTPAAQAAPVIPSDREKKFMIKRAKQMIVGDHSDEQIMSYLKRKGLDPAESLAALGEARANPLNEAQKEASIKAVTKKYFDKEGNWIGRRDLNKVDAQQEARAFQNDIRESVRNEPTQRGVKWQDVDKAIHIYLDLKSNPGHLKEFYPKLNDEQKKIVDLSQNLTAKQKEIADSIKEQYEELGEEARHAGVIKDVIENYVARAWEMKGGKPATEEAFKFKTSTKHSLHRTLDTILEGQAEGMKLKIEGASNNLAILKQEIGNVIENQRHLDDGLAMKIDSGEKDAKGRPIMKTFFSTTQEDGYEKIENPSFKKWEFAGKIEDYPEQDAQAFGRRRDVLIGEDGTVMKKSDVYAPKEVAKSLNNVLGSSKLTGNALVQGVTKFNMAVKQSMLSYSGFHFIAFTRAHTLASNFVEGKPVNPITAYKAGLDMLASQHPYGRELIKHGMTISRQQDFLEGVNSHNTWLGKQLDKMQFTKVIKDKLIDLNTQFHKYLFETYGTGLKMFDGINMVKAELEGKHFTEHDAIFKRVAKLMNDTYGGINWQRMHGSRMQDPTTRHLVSLGLLAPDWTASNLRFAKKAFSKGEDGEGALYRKTWARVLLRGAMLTGAANAIMAVWDDKDEQGNTLSWQDAMIRRTRLAWDAGRMRSGMVDITPLYHFIGGDEKKRAYFSVFGAYTDPIKMLKTPADFLESKAAFITKLGLEAATSQNWQHKEFTTLDELLGMDDKGQYTKTQKAHEQGDVSPFTGKPYVSAAKGHEQGEEKGGKMEGQLTKYPKGGAHPITYEQTPSFVLSEIRGMMPNAIQSLWQVAAGENDATTGVLNAMGSSVYFSKDPTKK